MDSIVEVPVEQTVHVPVPMAEVPFVRIVPVTVEVPVTSVMETKVSTVVKRTLMVEATVELT